MPDTFQSTHKASLLQLAVPRPDVLESDLSDAIFAADFADVINKTAAPTYQNAKPFFQNTHPAKPLQRVVSTVFTVLSDPNRQGGTIRLSTGFGGGKSHTLITLWHLAHNTQNLDIGAELLPTDLRPAQVKVVAIDASKAGVPEFNRHGSRIINSLWGEVFWQLAGEKGMAVLGEADHPHASPSEAQLDAVLPHTPLLILVDELVIYMKKLDDRGQGNLMGFMNLLAAKSSSKIQMVVVVTDPAAQQAYARESEKLGKQLEASRLEEKHMHAAANLDDLLGRKASNYDPIGDETAQVIVRRLFESVNQNAAEDAAARYESTFRRIMESDPTLLPSDALKYARRIKETFPFHPRLLDTVRNRLAALPDFQTSRGTLRLFARVLRSIHDQKIDLPLISAGDIDWGDDRITADLLHRLNREEFKAAVSADIKNHALDLDGGKRSTHTRAASALLLESIPMLEKSGLTRQDLTLAVLRPDEAGIEVGEALDHLVGQCWHLYVMPGGDGYQFRHQANVTKQIEERMATISREDARRRVLSEALEFYKATAGEGLKFSLQAWPQKPHQVPSRKDLTLVLAENVELAKRVVALEDDRDGQEKPRQYRNAIVAVAPASNAFEDAISRAQRFIAAESIRREHEEISDANAQLTLEQLKKTLPELRRNFQFQTRRAFTQVVLTSDVYPLEEAYLVGQDEVLQGNANFGQRNLSSFLHAKALVYENHDKLDPDYFLQILRGATPRLDGSYTTQAAYERLLSAPLQRLVTGQSLIRNTIREAVDKGRIVILFESHLAYGLGKVVEGKTGNRLEISQKPNLSAVGIDDKHLIAPADADVAKNWLQVDEPAPIDDPAKVVPPPLPVNPVPPPPVHPKDVWLDNPISIKQMASKRHLRKLVLTGADPAIAGGIATLVVQYQAQASDIRVSLTVDGKLQDGDRARMDMRGVKINHPLKPLDMARTLYRSCVPVETHYKAEFTFTFEPPVSGEVATAILEKMPERAEAKAQFGDES